MRVLWLCNMMLPAIAQELGIPASNKEGWLTGLYGQLMERGRAERVELAVCFPLGREEEPMEGCCGEMHWFGFPEDTAHPERYDSRLEQELGVILDKWKPDLVHVFGTEFAHTLAMARCMTDRQRLLVGVQGICSAIAEHYLDGIPIHVQKRFLLRDFLKQDNLRQQQEKFAQRGVQELEALRLAGHIAGRTAWDRRQTEACNPEARYHVLNETLRPVFYRNNWRPERCERHSIFVSQANYPIKGFHYLLAALPKIREQIPDVRVYVSGDPITGYDTRKERLKIGSYGKYCRELLHRGGLEETVVFLGRLDAEQMCARYLESGLFLSCSVLENSPNSVGEAMLLGMPVVSSRVGGVASMLQDGAEGLLYTCGDENALVHAVCTMLTDTEFAVRCGKQARVHALQTHDGQKNFERLMEIYRDMLPQKEK